MKYLGNVSFVCVLACAAAGTVVHAQQVSPTVAEFTKKARGTIQVTNVSKEPKIVSCAAQGFDADEHGAAHAHPLDSGLHVRLSTGRIELPADGTRQISFDATPAVTPAWFMVTCQFVPVQRNAGLNIALDVSSIVVVRDKQFDTDGVALKAQREGDKVRIEVTNSGTGLARVDSGQVIGHRAQADLGTFLLYPHQRRLVLTDWKQSVPPNSVRIQIGKKRMETAVN